MPKMRLKSLDEMLFKQLQNRDFAHAYLEDALSDSVDEFLIVRRKYGHGRPAVLRDPFDFQEVDTEDALELGAHVEMRLVLAPMHCDHLV